MENKPTPETLKDWNNNPKYWHFFGFIYFNKEDKRIFPPKKEATGFGWTTNFANVFSVLALIAIMTLIYLIVNYIRNH